MRRDADDVRIDASLPQTEVVCKVEERCDGCAGCKEHDFERQLLRVGEGAVFDAVGACVVYRFLSARDHS